MHGLHAPVAELLRDVGRNVLLKHYRRLADHQVMEKSPGDLVTIADHESEERLSAALSALLPDAAIVGEEAAASDPAVLDRLNHDLCWIIDPVDGTHNFAHGHPPFGILLALAEAGETIAGWIYDPLVDRLCHAMRDKGAWLNDASVRARPSGEALPVAAISLMFLDAARRADVKARCAGHYRMVDIPRCAAEQYPRLVLGQNDISLFERTLPWDHAAGILFLNEAGGMAARHDGTPYRVGDDRTGLIAAATPRLWEEAAALLA